MIRLRGKKDGKVPEAHSKTFWGTVHAGVSGPIKLSVTSFQSPHHSAERSRDAHMNLVVHWQAGPLPGGKEFQVCLEYSLESSF